LEDGTLLLVSSAYRMAGAILIADGHVVASEIATRLQSDAPLLVPVLIVSS
jgi:hypothetical protein